MIELVHSDCLSYMRTLPDNSFDLTITSPPYNMNLRVRGDKYTSRQIVKEISTKYQNFPDNMSMEDYYTFNVMVLEQLLRVSSTVFYNIQILTGNKPAIFKLMGHFHKEIKEIVIWDKINSQPSISVGTMNSRFEIILILSKSGSISRRFENAQFKKGTLENIWQIKRGKKVHKQHGAVFPKELVEKILKNFSTEGDKVLDPFMGTGTTGEVCKELGRNFTGIEIDKGYFKFCEDRLLTEENLL